MTKFTKEQQAYLEANIEMFDDYLRIASIDGRIQEDVRGSIFGDVLGNVGGTIYGNVGGTIYGNVGGRVRGTINGRKWKYVKEENK